MCGDAARRLPTNVAARHAPDAGSGYLDTHTLEGDSLMKKALLFPLCGAFAAGTMLWLATPSARAIKPFKDEFTAKYVKPDSTDPTEQLFAEAVATAKCNVCHVGKSKRNRNAYGIQLAELLDKSTDKDNKEKIRTALDKVAAIKADPANPNAPTFGQLIAAGKLPGGDPE